MLSRSGGKYTGRTGSVNRNLLCRSFPASGGKNKAVCADRRHTVTADERHVKAGFGFFDSCDKSQNRIVDFLFKKFVHEPFGIFRTRKLFFKADKSEAVMYALFQYAAESVFPFDKQNSFPGVMRSDCGGKSGRSSADYNHIIILFHLCHRLYFVLPNVITESSEDFLTSEIGTPRYSAIIFVTSGEQKPP